MKSKKIIISEIHVDRENEKWVFVFQQILETIHSLLWPKSFLPWKNSRKYRPNFSFEIANIKWKLRFFLVTTDECADFLETQLYAHFPNIEIKKLDKDYIPEYKWLVWNIWLDNLDYYPIKTYANFDDKTEKDIVVDPLSALTSALHKSSWDSIKIIQINFSPLWCNSWKSDKHERILYSNNINFIKNILLSRTWYSKYFLYILIYFYKILTLFISKTEEELNNKDSKEDIFREKLCSFWFETSINIWYFNSENQNKSKYKITDKIKIKNIANSLAIFSKSGSNNFVLKKVKTDKKLFLKHRTSNKHFILNTIELAWLVHLPTIYVQTPGINWITSKTLEPPYDLPIVWSDKEITPIWITNYRSWIYKFWIKPWDRRRHMYIVWKTWMWKSTLLENMIFDDIVKWRWVWLVDPHWDLADTIIEHIPPNRTNDVILFDPADSKFPVAFNMLEPVEKDLRPIVASWLVWIFKKLFSESWGPRLEHILRNTILTLLEVPDSTLLSIPLILTQSSWRKKVVSKVTDPIVKKFWESEFDRMQPAQQVEAIWPILNKVWQFLSSSLIRNILWQPKNPFSLRWAMDNKKIVIINLSKWKIWEDSSALLWAMMITKFQIDAMTRANISEKDRTDFYLYVDEFQNFATDSFATILSEARKYKLNLVMANQYINQMSEEVRYAVFWNVWTSVSFQVWYEDAQVLSSLMDENIVNINDLQNLKKYTIYMKLLIDWMPSKTFSALTMPPIFETVKWWWSRREKVLKVCRQKYSKKVEFVEKKINQYWNNIINFEAREKKRIEAYKNKKKAENQKKHEEMLKKHAQFKNNNSQKNNT